MSNSINLDEKLESFLINEFNLENKQKELLYVLLYSAFCMEKFQIRYVLFGGTLLGAIRNKNLIAWDDDIDLMVIGEDAHKLKSPLFVQELQKYNLNIVYESRYAFHIYLKDANESSYENCIEISQTQYWRGIQSVNNKKPIGGSSSQIDIFIYSKDSKTNKYKYCSHYSKALWKNYRPFAEHELFPLKRYQLNNFYFYGPNSYHNYFDSFIKDNYLKNYIITHCHSSELKRFVSKNKIRLPYTVSSISLQNLHFDIENDVIINLYHDQQFDNNDRQIISNIITNTKNI